MRRAAPAPGHARRRRLRAATTLARILVVASPLLVAAVPSPSAAQGPGAPVDRTVIAIPPIYPAPAPSFLRLPETRSVPILPARAIHAPVPVGAASIPTEVPGGQPIWQPARLEAVPGIDARGRITAILEYTPGRFDR